MKKPLIDADIIAYRIAASCQDEMENVNYWRIDDCINNIHESLGSMLGAKYFLTGTDNFRKKIDPQYKANRTQPKPIWLQHCRDYLVRKYNAVVCDGYEADDAMGMGQDDSTIICTIDKDLLMVPGEHYNWVRNEFKTVTEDEGMRFFWEQMMIGDRSDNVVGIAGIGPVKAKRIIDACTCEEDMFIAVRDIYDDDTRFLKNANLLWIWRNQGEMWQHALPHLYKQLEINDPSTEEATSTEPDTTADSLQVQV